jgi:hypothetical protein
MVAGSVLIDWHVARTMGSSKKEIDAYTGIRYALRCRTSSVAQQLAAIRELGLMRPWARTASLPELCACVRLGSPAVVDAVHDTVFSAILEQCTHPVRAALANSLSEFYSGSIAAVLTHLRALSGLLANIRGAEGPDRTHFSLERNEEIALVLAMLEVLVVEDPDEAAELVTRGPASDVARNGPIDLIDRCLSSAHGRFQLLLAVDVCLAIGDLRRAEDGLASVSTTPEREPDVLHRYAHLAYLTESSAGENDVVEWAAREISAFSHLRRLLGGKFDKAPRHEKLETAAFWQDALLRAATRGPIEQVATVIGSLLRPRLINIPRSTVIVLPTRVGNDAPLGCLYAELLREAGETVDQVRFASTGLQSAHAVAPWFHPDRKRMRPRTPWLPQEGLYLRLVSWSAITCELLNAIGTVSERYNWARYLGTFLLHAYHWLEALERARDHPGVKISEDIADLAYAGQQLVESTAGGRYENPAPAFFVNLATDIAENGFFGADAGDAEPEDTERRQDSVDRQFDSVLVLLQRAVAVTEDEYRVGRWLEDTNLLSDSAIRWFSGRPRPSFRAVNIARCLKRFIERIPASEGSPSEDPLAEVRKSGTWTSIKHHRALLLRDTGRFADWTCGEFPIPVTSFGHAAALTIALQRVAAARNDADTPPEIGRAWVSDLRRLLSIANSAQDFDRFLQFRFAEVLRENILQDNPEIIALVVSRLLEFGSNHTFRMLSEWLLRSPIEADIDANLRIQVFETISRYVWALENAHTGVAEPRSPESRARHLARAHVLERLAACSLATTTAEGLGLNAAVLIAARGKRDARVGHHVDEMGVNVPVEVEADGGVLPISDHPEADLRTATLVTFDPTQATLRRIGPTPRSLDGLNLFAGAFPDARARRSYVGFVVVGDGTQARVCLRPGEVISARTEASLDFQQGQLISASCGPVRQGRFDPTQIGTIIGLSERRRIEHWQVTPEWLEGSLGMEFRVAPPGQIPGWLWTEQTPNFLAVFACCAGAKLPYQIRVAVDPQTRQAAPAIGRFSDLLLDSAEELATGTDIALCLKSLARSEQGDLAYIEVETWPLRCYRLDARFDLAPEGRGSLEVELARLGTQTGATGLLLLARLSTTNEGPCITLAPQKTALRPPWSDEVIHGPFDDRNLRWRQLFAAPAEEEIGADELAAPLLATRMNVGNTYTAELPQGLRVQGFPSSVELEFASQARRLSTVPATIDRDRDGRPHQALFYADEVSTNVIERLNPVETKELIDWLLDSTEDRVFEIWHFAKSVSRVGLVRAFTRENLPLQILAESLSLAPLKVALASDVWVRRRAFGRTHYRRSERAPEFDVAQVPEAAFDEDVARGILTSIPATKQGEIALCRVAWRTRQGIDEQPISIENLHEVSRRRPELGSRVSVDRRTTPPSLKLEQPSILAEALWQCVDAETLDLTRYVGTAEVDGLGGRDLFEQAPGRIALVVPDPDAGPPHVRFAEGCLVDRTLATLTQNPMRSVPFRRDPSWRLALAVGSPGSDREEAYLCGLSASDRPAQGRSRLTGYEIQIDNKPGQPWLRIRRRLRVRSDEGPLPVQVPLPALQRSEPEDHARRHQLERALLLDGWLSDAFVEGRHDHRSNSFAPRHPRAQRLVPEGVAILPSGFSRRSPHAPTEGYSRHPARLVLRGTNPPIGSYVDVPSASLDDLITALGSPEQGNIISVDDVTLYYVGFEREADGKTTHLFEWGYGWWTRIDDASLRYKGAPVEQGELVLAFGDWITAIRLIDDGDRTILSIEETELSSGHILYKQAKEQRILHVLHVSSSRDEDVRIERVEGYDSRHATAIIRHFPRLGAVLEPTTAREVSNLILDKLDGTKARETVVLYARLMTEQFKSSGGAEVVYRGVRIGSEARNGFEGLSAGDRIFVRARGRVDLPNDIGLSVEPLPALARELIDPSAYALSDRGEQRREWLITRRAFSYDESALARITSGDYGELESRILLVRLARTNHGRLEFTHSNGAPPRDPEVLDGLLAQAGGMLFCVFAERRTQSAGNGTIRLELRPGALIDVDAGTFELPDELEAGDILRIERHEANGVILYRGVFAVFSDRRYARSRRPAVALPTNPLANRLLPPFKRAADFREALASFTVGDFRQLVATFAEEVSSSDSSGLAALEQFMTTPHPKLAWLHIDGKAGAKGTFPKLSPDDQRQILAGRLELAFGEEGELQAPGINAVPLENANPTLANLSIDWPEVTFSDGSAREIAERLSSASWSYHDQRTIVWKPGDRGNLIAERSAVGRHTVWTGPLFFVRNGRTATLRYSADQIADHAIGFANLRVELPRVAQPPLHGVVVGVPADKGLYVEFLPGRIYEVPSALCSSDEYDSISLDHLAWDAFGVGDAIALRRAPELTDRHGQEGVLLSWEHGVRNAIGPFGALMPRTGADRENGFAVFGAGQFTVTIPTSKPDEMWDLAIIGSDKPIRRPPFVETHIGDVEPRVGELVFLAVDEQERIGSAEHPRWTVVPDRGWISQSDPLTQDAVFATADGRKGFNARRMAEIVRQAGGAFAVTVESVVRREDSKSGLIFVSRRLPRISRSGPNGRDGAVMPSPGDTIAVTVSDRNRVQAVGLLDAAVVPDNNWAWEREPLMQGLVFKDEKGRKRFDQKRLSESADAAGGALPFTVEGVARLSSGEPGPIFVSRRLQIQTRESAKSSKRPLVSGTTVLLLAGTRGELEIAGLPDWIPEPASQNDDGEEIDWRADSLLRNAIERDGVGRLLVDKRRITERITIVGGALPVTLENAQFGPAGAPGRVFYSRRNQNARLDPGAIALARVVGFLPGIESVVLAIGGRHLELPARRLVDGAPRELWPEIAAVLAQAKAKLWVHRISDGYHVGVQKPILGNISVRSLAIASNPIAPHNDQPREAKGVVCVGSIDHRLYWLAVEEAGATRFTFRQLETAFPPGATSFEVVRLPQGGVSVVQHARVKAEVRRLRPGITTTVRPIAHATADLATALPQFAGALQGKCCLARSTATGTLMSLVLDDNDATEYEAAPIPVEVAWRWHDGRAVRLAAVKRGRRPMRSDIPSSLFWTPKAPLAPAESIIYGVEQAQDVSRDHVPELAIEDLRRSTRALLDEAAALVLTKVYGLRTALTILRMLGEDDPSLATEIDETFWALASDVGRRALRSYHLEPLAQRHARSLRGEILEYETQGLHTRIEEILALASGASGSVTAGEVAEKLEAIVLSASLYPQPDDATYVVHALSAGMGGRHDLGVLLRGSTIISCLVTTTRPFCLGRNAFAASDRKMLELQAMQTFQKIAERLQEDDFDIPLPRGFASMN